jgi:hypothetical protein
MSQNSMILYDHKEWILYEFNQGIYNVTYSSKKDYIGMKFEKKYIESLLIYKDTFKEVTLDEFHLFLIGKI